jgi:RNA polymerase sigma factor (sigma-70 family)
MEKIPHIDQRYIKGLLNNDTTLINEIYSKYSGKVAGMIVANNGSQDDASDIFQEALVDIYKKAATGNFILTCPFEALLIIICKNKWITILEKNKRQGVTFKDPEGYSYGTDTFKETEQVTQYNERRNLLEAKFTELGEGCRELLQHSWGGKAMDEVAQLLKVTYAYVRKKKSECMGKLTELIKKSSDYKLLMN